MPRVSCAYLPFASMTGEAETFLVSAMLSFAAEHGEECAYRGRTLRKAADAILSPRTYIGRAKKREERHMQMPLFVMLVITSVLKLNSVGAAASCSLLPCSLCSSSFPVVCKGADISPCPCIARRAEATLIQQ